MVLRRGDRRSRIWLEELEPRWLLSADIAPFAAPEAPFPESQIHEAVVGALQAETPAVAAPIVPGRLELVFVDTRVPDYEQLVADIQAQNDGWRRVEVVVLDPQRDGIAQVTEVLAARLQLDAVHFISHGTDGAVELGGSWLDANALAANEAAIAGWGQALKADGDLLFYGCDVAESSTGKAFLDQLASLTHADIAASSDFTGAEALGGDWQLEFTLGVLESDVILSAHAQTAWEGLLSTQTLDWDAVPTTPLAETGVGTNVYTTTYGVGGGTVTVTVSDPADRLRANGSPVLSNVVTGGLAAPSNSLRMQSDGFQPGEAATVTITFAGFPGGVSNVGLLLFDIDTADDGVNFVDRVVFSGNNGAVIDPTAITVGPAASVAAGLGAAAVENAWSYNSVIGTNTVEGRWTGNNPIPLADDPNQEDNSPDDRSNGNAYAVFGQSGITTVSFTYSNAPGRTASGQGISLFDITFDPTPTASDRTVAVNEDAVYTFAAGDFGFTDIDGDTLQAVRITALETAGALKLNGVDVTLNQVIPVASIGLLTYAPAANGNGAPYDSFRFQVGDGTSFSASDYAMTVNVNAVADTPSVTNAATLEDTQSTSGLVISRNPADGAEVTHFKVTGITGGTLFLNDGTTAVANGNFITAAQGAAGLRFTPAPDSVTAGAFDVQASLASNDAGLGGSVVTATIAVTAVNDVPVRTAGAVNDLAVLEDSGTTGLGLGALTYTPGPANEAAQTLTYTVTMVPAAALGDVVLADGTTVVVAGNAYSLAQLQGMQFRTATNANGAGTFTFTVVDDGGTANFGVDTLTESLNISVTAVNDAPTLALAGNQTVAEDAGVQSVAAFAVATPGGGADEAAQTFSYAVTNDNNALFAAQPVIDASGTLTYTSAADQFGSATVTVFVTDSGGMLNGGVDTTGPLTFILTVTPVNDAPVLATNAGLTVDEGAAATLTPAMLSVTDVDNTPPQLVYTATSVPANGRLERIATPGVAIAAFTQDDLDNGRIRYLHDGSETLADGFTFVVSDGAGGAIGPTLFAITVNPVNDAPALTANRLILSDGQTVTLSLSDLDATDPDNANADLTFTVSGVTHGHFELAGTPGVAIASFTYNELASSSVLFVHAGDNQAPSYTVTPSDLALAGTTVAAQVTFTPASSSSDGGVLVKPLNTAGDDPLTVLVPPEPSISGGSSLEAPRVDAPIPVPRGLETFDVLAPPSEPEFMPVRSAARAAQVSGFAKTDPFVQTESMDLLRLPGPVVRAELGQLDFDGPQRRSNIEVLVEMARMGGVALTVGAVWWATRAAGLLASALSSLPAWRHFDPLPVLGRDEFNDDDWVEEFDRNATTEIEEEERLVGRRFSNMDTQPLNVSELRKALTGNGPLDDLP